MAKQSGLGDALLVAGYDVSGDINSLGRVGGGPAALDMTGIRKSAFERVGGVRDGSMDFVAFFNPGPEADAAHLRFSTLPTADVLATYCRGTALGAPAASCRGKQIGYDGSRGADGAFTFAVSVQSTLTGIEWGRLLTPDIRTDTGATNGASIDHGAATDFGAQAYLHVTAFTGTDATIKLQHSTDDAAWADVTGGGFAAVTAGPTSERIATAGNLTVNRYLRVVTTTTDGFTGLSFLVAVVRNEVAVAF